MRILHYIYGLNTGGAETFIKNLSSCLPHNYEFHFAIQNHHITNEYFLRYFQNNSDRFHILPIFYKHPLQHYKELNKLIHAFNYDFIHIHMNSMVNPLPFLMNKKHNSQIILHSHSAKINSGGIISLLFHSINSKLLIRDNYKLISCSKKAGKWMFGNHHFTILSNPIDISHFQFSKFSRDRIRSTYGISESTFLLGTVARLVPQKQIDFVIKIFNKLVCSQNLDCKLLIVGDGPEYNNLVKLAKSLKLEPKIIFMGNQQDPAPYYSALDCFLMPSKFEGLGITAIEAQSAGLNSVLSTNIPNEVKINDNVIFADNKKIDDWIMKIQKFINYNNNHREEYNKKMLNSRFNIVFHNENISKLYNNC